MWQITGYHYFKCRYYRALCQPTNIKTSKYIFYSGSCIGIEILAEVKPSYEDCLHLCNSTLGCRWFSYYSLVDECILFQTCPTIDESFEYCISGERRCIDDVTTTTSTTTTTPTTPISTTTEVIPKGLFLIESSQSVATQSSHKIMRIKREKRPN
jgi:hypothetical protein